MNALRLIKRPVTLVEMIIAMALTALILTSLTFFYRQVSQIDLETERVIARNFQQRYAETRLAEVLPRTVAANKQNRDFVFFSFEGDGVSKLGSQSLIFTYDNGISLEKEFSNNVLGRIYLDQEGNLTLAYWPSPLRWDPHEPPPLKKEVLLQGVSNLAFEFYIPPYKQDVAETPESMPKKGESGVQQEGASAKEKEAVAADEEPAQQPEPAGGWRQQPWLQEYKQLPAMVRMRVGLAKEKKEILFAFPLPNRKTAIIYPL